MDFLILRGVTRRMAARTHILASLFVYLLASIVVTATFAPQAGAEPDASTWQQRVDQLQAEVQDQKQTIALLRSMLGELVL